LNFQVALGALGQWYAFLPINVSNASNTSRSRRQILAIGLSTAIFGLSDQSDAETCEACCLKDSLEPQTTIYKWMFQLDDSKSLYRKSLFHQTSIYKWLFKVPGRYFGILKGKSSLGGA